MKKNVYLDYAATTKIDSRVLKNFQKEIEYFGNPNSNHQLGKLANKRIEKNTNYIAKLLDVKPSEIIYTSGASEANNLALKGICSNYQNGHILTTRFEHSSIISTLNYLSTRGFEIDFLETNKDGVIQIETLKKQIKPNTILITIASVSSEIGIIQPIHEIGKYLKAHYPNIIFHVDATQTIGKIPINLKFLDLLSMSSHKIFGIKGIGLLIKKESINLTPLIHGGKSTTIYRSGTPQTELIAALKKSLELAYHNIDQKYEYVSSIKKDLTEFLNKFSNIKINSCKNTSPYILNFSFLKVPSKILQKELNQKGIYVSTKTACSIGDRSDAIYHLTKDNERSLSSIRLSFSYKTTKEDINYFKKIFTEIYKKRSK